MSRGVVLWLDVTASAKVRRIWNELAERGIPSHATHTHRLHEPHVSLVVAEDFPVDVTLEAVGNVPRRAVPFRIESVGIFPDAKTLFLACVPNGALLEEQRRVHDAVIGLARDPWPWFKPDGWVPHITVSMSLTPGQLAEALPIAMQALPISGTFERGGLEDGTTGERWKSWRRT
jgi:2'-5' RNA ligase